MVKTLAVGCTLHVVLCPADLDGLGKLLTEQFDLIGDIISEIDVRKGAWGALSIV
jgi:hypothetical protein